MSIGCGPCGGVPVDDWSEDTGAAIVWACLLLVRHSTPAKGPQQARRSSVISPLTVDAWILGGTTNSRRDVCVASLATGVVGLAER